MNAVELVGDVASSLVAIPGPPTDPDFHDPSVLLAELATLNQGIARYITAALEADAKRGGPVSSAQEAALAQRLIDLGQRLQRRAEAIRRNWRIPSSGGPEGAGWLNPSLRPACSLHVVQQQ